MKKTENIVWLHQCMWELTELLHCAGQPFIRIAPEESSGLAAEGEQLLTWGAETNRLKTDWGEWIDFFFSQELKMNNSLFPSSYFFIFLINILSWRFLKCFYSYFTYFKITFISLIPLIMHDGWVTCRVCSHIFFSWIHIHTYLIWQQWHGWVLNEINPAKINSQRQTYSARRTLRFWSF